MPSMLCICDTSKTEEPIYWIWLNEALKEIERVNPECYKQLTLSISIPTSQVLLKENREQIESYVRNFHTELRINAAIGDVVGSGFGASSPAVLTNYRDRPREFVMQQVVPHLRDAGIVDLVEEEEKIESFTPEEQKLYRKLSAASSFLNTFHDKEAIRILDELEGDIEKASDGIKARYFNNRGVLSLHLGNQDLALEYFKKAHELRPNEKNYSTNVLLVQHELSLSTGNPSFTLPEDWEERLETIISKYPGYLPTIRLKARRLGKSRSPEEAESFLRNSPDWEKEPVHCLGYLAEIYIGNGQADRALSLLNEAKSLNLPLDGLFWSLYGCSLLCKALESADVIRGYGSPKINTEYLLLAKECYDKAIKEFASKGFPAISDAAVSNQTLILVMLGTPEEPERICRSYLEQDPDNGNVNSLLAMSLFHQDKATDAIPYARIAFEASPNTKLEYRNLALCLFASDEFEDLIELISKREQSGFRDSDEEGLSRELLSVAYFELGEDKLANRQIEFMKSNPELLIKAAMAGAFIARRSGKSKEDIIKVYHSALTEHPENEELLTQLIRNLLPVSGENAEDISKMLETVSKKRQLTPEEFSILGNAYLYLDPAKSYKAIVRAFDRYPNTKTFLLEMANALVQIGDEESAFKKLQEYFETGKKNYELLRNMAVLALNTGRLDDAIKLLQMGLRRTEDLKERGIIHYQLWEFKTRRNDPPKDILRHAFEYGRSTENDVAAEARFLMMCLITTMPVKEDELDEEVNEWLKEIRSRLEKFTKEHPRYEGFMKFTLPENLSDEDKALHFLSEIYAIMLPHHLAITPFEMSTRIVPWPLPLRAKILREANSIYRLWEICTSSKDFSHALHIWTDSNNLEKEHQSAVEAKEICIDLTALLTLAELNLLNILTDCFELIIIARGTKIALDKALFDPFGYHPIAEKIEKWRLANRKNIRIRSWSEKYNEHEKIDEYEMSRGGIWIPRETKYSLDVLVGDGVGESLMLAQKIRIPLYSDESVVRHWADKDYNIKTFSTISFINRLRISGVLSIGQEAYLQAELIRKNFQIIPFQPQHLHFRLKEILKERRTKGYPEPKSDDLKNDEILGTFLRQFGDSSLNTSALLLCACNWWLLILTDTGLERELSESVIDEILVESMHFPSFSLSMRTDAGVLKGIYIKEKEERLAATWAFFLWRAYRINERLTHRAWSTIKSCCERLFAQSEEKCKLVLSTLIPNWLLEVIKLDTSINNHQKLSCLVSLPQCFSEDERLIFENYFVRNVPDLMRH